MAKRTLAITILVEVDDAELDFYEMEQMARDLPASLENRLSDDGRVVMGNVYRSASGAEWADEDGFEYAETKLQMRCGADRAPIFSAQSVDPFDGFVYPEM
jgi:hypothetical protein